MRIIIGGLVAIITFFSLILFVDGSIANWLFHLLGGIEGTQFALITKILIWAILVGFTGGVSVIISVFLTLLVVGLLEVLGVD